MAAKQQKPQKSPPPVSLKRGAAAMAQLMNSKVASASRKKGK